MYILTARMSNGSNVEYQVVIQHIDIKAAKRQLAKAKIPKSYTIDEITVAKYRILDKHCEYSYTVTKIEEIDTQLEE